MPRRRMRYAARFYDSRYDPDEISSESEERKRLKITRQPAAGREVGRTSGSSDSGMIYFSEK